MNHTLQSRIESAVRRPADLRADGWQKSTILEFMARENIPGASVAVIDRGEIDWAGCYGVREAGSPDPVTPETLFQAASISKPVAVLTMLSLVAEGRLALDENITAYQTAWRLPANHGWQPRVTLRQLCSHSAGITVEGFPGYAQDALTPTLAQILAGAPPANTLPIFVDTLPGLQFRYSGGGYIVLQQLLEDVSGIPFWKLAQERVLGPLGMAHSTYQVLRPGAVELPAASGHRTGGQPIAGHWHNYPESAAAGLWTTPTDLARLVIAIERTLAGQGEPLLPRELVREMLASQITIQGMGSICADGLGWFLSREGKAWYFGHGGDNEGFHASLIVHKGRGQAAVVMTNSEDGWLLIEAFESAVAEDYGWAGFAWSPPAALALPAGSCARFTGDYTLENGKNVTVRETPAGLSLEVASQPALEMLPREPETFYLTQLNVEVSFSEDGLVLN